MKARFTRGAVKQIEDALAYVEAESRTGARRLRDRIEATVDLILQHPLAGQTTARAGVRRVVLAPFPYVIFYRVEDDELIILRFRHAARKPI